VLCKFPCLLKCIPDCGDPAGINHSVVSFEGGHIIFLAEFSPYVVAPLFCVASLSCGTGDRWGKCLYSSKETPAHVDGYLFHQVEIPCASFQLAGQWRFHPQGDLNMLVAPIKDFLVLAYGRIGRADVQ
jgi:hypothetical protein